MDIITKDQKANLDALSELLFADDKSLMKKTQLQEHTSYLYMVLVSVMI